MFYTFYTFPCFSTNLQDIHILHPHSQLQVSTISGSKALSSWIDVNVIDILDIAHAHETFDFIIQIYITKNISFQPKGP